MKARKDALKRVVPPCISADKILLQGRKPLKKRRIKRKSSENYVKIITGTKTIKKTLYEIKILGEILLPGKYYYRINFVKRKLLYYYRGSAVKYYN